MKSMDYLAGIDAGTTGTTVMLVDLNGNLKGSAYREYPCIYPHPGWVEQDIELVWRMVCEAGREVIDRTGVDPHRIRSIGISSQRGTFVCVDKTAALPDYYRYADFSPVGRSQNHVAGPGKSLADRKLSQNRQRTGVSTQPSGCGNPLFGSLLFDIKRHDGNRQA